MLWMNQLISITFKSKANTHEPTHIHNILKELLMLKRQACNAKFTNYHAFELAIE